MIMAYDWMAKLVLVWCGLKSVDDGLKGLEGQHKQRNDSIRRGFCSIPKFLSQVQVRFFYQNWKKLFYIVYRPKNIHIAYKLFINYL